MTSNIRRRSEVTLCTLIALAYAWFATGARPFTAPAYLLLAVPSFAALLAYGALGGFSPHRHEVANYYRARSRRASWRRTAPWTVVGLSALALESVGLALGGRSTGVPTLSTTIDHLLVAHWGRFVLFALWLAVGANPLRRLLLVQRRAHE